MSQLKRYLVEREIAGIGGMSLVELCGAARASNQAIAKLGSDIQWQHSYVAGDIPPMPAISRSTRYRLSWLTMLLLWAVMGGAWFSPDRHTI